MRKPDCFILLIIVVLTAPLNAAITRTFVASNGLDSNPCNRAAPCRKFAAAIAQTLPGGEVVALDSAGYRPIPSINSVAMNTTNGAFTGSGFAPQ